MPQYRVPVLENFEFQQAIKDKDLTAPPGSPATGDRYIVASPATGAWAGQEKNIAYWNGTAWIFDVPAEGWLTWIQDENAFYFYNGSLVWTIEPTGDMTKAVYDTDADGIVDKAESVDDGIGNVTTAVQVKDAYDRRGSYNASLKAILFTLP